MNYRYKPQKYFFLTILITWITGFLAAYVSYTKHLAQYKIPLLLIGMFAPFIVAMFMIYGSKSKELKQDFKSRFNLKLIKPKYWLAILIIMPIILILATSISLLFGQSSSQFNLAPELLTIGGEVIIILIILILAPTFEELGWRGYGVDSLKKGNTIFKASLIYFFLWNAWHIPLFFVNGYYQNELFHLGAIYTINFIVSLFPASFLMNWIYYKNSRSITAIIIFHAMINFYSVLLQTEQFTKVIITILLTILTIFIIYKDKEFFFKQNPSKCA